MGALIALLCFSAALVIAGYAALMLAILSLPFLAALMLRLHAIWRSQAPLPDRPHALLEPTAELPVYTLLVPLFREANVARQLVEALGRLDYPPERLDVLLITEDCDAETRAALLRADPPAHMHVLVVPEGQPRTKPRALNYALTFAKGAYVVVYDAEDEPEPDQLRRALAQFEARKGERIGCLQARLNIYNPAVSWLTRQFTIEYTALFDHILPALERLALPVPLGGTSNHFPREALDEAGGWDPHNVTEDADLGIRLMRRGWNIAVLASTTWEEAPASRKEWLPQRKRWLKGWMQTVLVHTRQPRRLLAELGPWRTSGFLLLMGGLIVSALLHPWFMTSLALGWYLGWLDWPASHSEWLLLIMAAFHFVAGYATAMALGAIAVRQRGLTGLARHVGMMAFYWLAISYAAHCALWQLVRAPHLWEKTPHSGRSLAGQFTPARKS